MFVNHELTAIILLYLLLRACRSVAYTSLFAAKKPQHDTN